MKTPPAAGAPGSAIPRIDNSTAAGGADGGTAGGGEAGLTGDAIPDTSPIAIAITTARRLRLMSSPPGAPASLPRHPRAKWRRTQDPGNRATPNHVDKRSLWSYSPATFWTEARGRVPLAPRRGIGAGVPDGRRRHTLIPQRQESALYAT